MHVPSIQLTPCKGRWRNATSLLACPLASDRRSQNHQLRASTRRRPRRIIHSGPAGSELENPGNLVNRLLACFVSSSISSSDGDGATPSFAHQSHGDFPATAGGGAGTSVDETARRVQRKAPSLTLGPASSEHLSEHGSACPRFVAKALRLHVFDSRGLWTRIAPCAMPIPSAPKWIARVRSVSWLHLSEPSKTSQVYDSS